MPRLLALAGVLLAATAARACPAPPQPVWNITAESVYTDPRHSVIDPEARARNRSSLELLDLYVREIVRLSDEVLATGSPEAGRCAGTWLTTWAQADALLGQMSGLPAEDQRGFRIAALAMAYLKLEEVLSEADRKAIEPWLERLAEAAEGRYAGRRVRNNLYYWTGLGAGAVGLAIGSEKHWSYARQVYAEAMQAIAPDGTLPLEMARGRRALDYHNFALAPLVMLAELAEQKGEHWYDSQGSAIHRLAGRVLDGLSDPAGFGRLAGTEIEVPSEGMLGWLAFYGRRFPARIHGLVVPRGRFRDVRLGGDLSSLAERWIN